MKKFLILIFIVVAGAIAASHFFQPKGENVKDTPLLLDSWAGDTGTVVKSENYVLRTQDEWLKAWVKTGERIVPQPLLKKQMAVALFSGEHLTSGYLIRVIDITEDKYALKVVYQDLKPSQTRLQASPYNTYPWTIVLMPANEKPVMFQKENSALWYQAVKIVTNLFNAVFVSGFNSKTTQ